LTVGENVLKHTASDRERTLGKSWVLNSHSRWNEADQYESSDMSIAVMIVSIMTQIIPTAIAMTAHAFAKNPHNIFDSQQ